MTFVEALKLSKERKVAGEEAPAFWRPLHSGWFRYKEGCVYKIDVDDALADDFEFLESDE